MIDLRWRHLNVGDGPIPTHGILSDEHRSVGTARQTSDGLNGEHWVWSMTAHGRQVVWPPSLLKHTSGRAPTKDEAKAACERCYRELVDAHPDNHAKILGHFWR